MRRILIFDRISPQGWFSDASGGLTWTVPEPEADRAGVAAMATTDLMLFGRTTYDMFARFWPHVADAPQPDDPHHAGRVSPELRAMAVWINATEKLVVSSTLTAPSWHNTRVMPAFDPAAIAALKRGPGKDIIVFGSGTIARQLAAHDLVDEYQLLVSPVLLGGGRPLFGELPRSIALRLVEAVPYPSGNVMLRYAPG